MPCCVFAPRHFDVPVLPSCAVFAVVGRLPFVTLRLCSLLALLPPCLVSPPPVCCVVLFASLPFTVPVFPLAPSLRLWGFSHLHAAPALTLGCCHCVPRCCLFSGPSLGCLPSDWSAQFLSTWGGIGLSARKTLVLYMFVGCAFHRPSYMLTHHTCLPARFHKPSPIWRGRQLSGRATAFGCGVRA